MNDLFDHAMLDRMKNEAPLAARMRPRTLDEFVRQEHIVGEGKLLRRAIEADKLFSSITLWGPPGTGKTTLAQVIANTTKSHFVTISAILAGKPELRIIIDEALERRRLYNLRTILFVDEVHRWNKAQQDALLPHVENGTVTLIGATTSCTCILAGIDLGAETEKIVSYAACFSSAVKAPVRLLYVMDYLLTPPSYLMPYVEEERKRGEAEMARLQSVLEKTGVSSDFRLMMGRLHESFVTAITEYKPDLLILGYASHAFRPSSSERLNRSLQMPMLVVRGKRPEEAAAGPAAIRKILCAVDFSENSRKALEKAAAYGRHSPLPCTLCMPYLPTGSRSDGPNGTRTSRKTWGASNRLSMERSGRRFPV